MVLAQNPARDRLKSLIPMVPPPNPAIVGVGDALRLESFIPLVLPPNPETVGVAGVARIKLFIPMVLVRNPATIVAGCTARLLAWDATQQLLQVGHG